MNSKPTVLWGARHGGWGGHDLEAFLKTLESQQYEKEMEFVLAVMRQTGRDMPLGFSTYISH